VTMLPSGCFDPTADDRGLLMLSSGWTPLPGAGQTQFIAGESFGDFSADALAGLEGTTCDGRYALAAIDRATRRLVLTRDPAGSVALFWHRDTAGRVHFATGLDSLCQGLARRPALSESGLSEYLRFLDIAAPNTLYEGVFALEAGQAVEFTASGHRELQTALPVVTPPASYDAACDEVERRLQAATDRRLAGSAAPAAFLSGGIDSALLCALASKSGHRVAAFTVGFDTPSLDESATAALIARHLGLEHHVLRPDGDALEAAFERAHAQAEQPYCDPAGMPTRLLFEACARQSDRVLDGTGAEALPGMMPARWRRIAHDWIAHLPAAPRHAIARALGTLPAIDGYARLFEFDVPQDLFIRWNGFTADDITRLTGRTPDFSRTRFYTAHAALRGASHLKRLSVLQGTATPDDRIHQASIATGLRVEHPFGAPDVTQLLQSLPEDWCWRPDRPKRLLRDLLARHVPEAIWNTPKRGFNIDLTGLLRSHDHRLLRRHLGDPSVIAQLPLDAAEVIRWRDGFIAGDDAMTHRVWALMNLSAWLSNRRTAASSLVGDPLSRLQ
jgi:asparagine synthase (glutamine-hydrolysing)